MTDIRQKALAAFRKTELDKIDNWMLWHTWKRAYHEGYDESQARIKKLEEFIKDVSGSLYMGDDLRDPEILDFYKQMTDIIKEDTKKILNQ